MVSCVDVELNNYRLERINKNLMEFCCGIKILDCVVSDERQPSLMSTIKWDYIKYLSIQR